jgi:hypothetical protein
VIDTLGCALESGDPLVGPVHQHYVSCHVSSFGSIGDGRIKLAEPCHRGCARPAPKTPALLRRFPDLPR